MAYSNSSNLNHGNGYINSSRQGNNGKWNGASNSGFNSGSQGSRLQDAPDAYTPLYEANYVAIAESAVKKLEKDQHEHYKLSTSKIRNILAMTSEILNKVNSNRGKDPALAMKEIMPDLNYLRIRLVYESGREPAVKDLERKSHLLSHLKDIKTLDGCELFCHYMEALVAYHRFNCGADQ